MTYSDESQDEAAFRQHGSLEAAQEAQTAIPARDVERALAEIESAVGQWESQCPWDGADPIANIKKTIAQARRDLGLRGEGA